MICLRIHSRGDTTSSLAFSHRGTSYKEQNSLPTLRPQITVTVRLLCGLSTQERISAGQSLLTCLCSLDLSHQFLHTSHISILNSEDQILFTTHSGPWAPETRAEAEKMVLAEASGCHALAFWRARRSGGVCLCPRQWASC